MPAGIVPPENSIGGDFREHTARQQTRSGSRPELPGADPAVVRGVSGKGGEAHTDPVRTHVSQCSGEIRLFACVLFMQSQTKIDNERLASGVDQDIARLDVAVNNSLFVRVVQRFGHARQHFCCFGVTEMTIFDLGRTDGWRLADVTY